MDQGGGFLSQLEALFQRFVVAPIESVIFFDLAFWDNGQPNEISLQLVVVWLILGAAFFTVRFQFINLRGFHRNVDNLVWLVRSIEFPLTTAQFTRAIELLIKQKYEGATKVVNIPSIMRALSTGSTSFVENKGPRYYLTDLGESECFGRKTKKMRSWLKPVSSIVGPIWKMPMPRPTRVRAMVYGRCEK